jgi:membrane-anchored protein YejM (alkaline phosphatase superfamily)
MMFSKVPNLRIESKGSTCYERDCEITDEFIDYIDKERNEPFFSLLFYDLAHGCELPAEKNTTFTPAWAFPDYLALNNSIDPMPFWNLYRNSLFQIDSLVGRVLTALEERDMLRNTVIVMTGDHGQEFNENKKNFWGHGSNFSPVQVRVPFMLFDAEKAVEVYKYRTTHYDVATTLLKEYLGVENPVTDLGVGQLMTDPCNRDWHYVGDYGNYAFVMDSDMRVLEKKHSGYIEVYDSLVNPIEGYKYNAVDLNKKIMDINRFYK